MLVVARQKSTALEVGNDSAILWRQAFAGETRVRTLPLTAVYQSFEITISIDVYMISMCFTSNLQNECMVKPDYFS